MDSRARVEAALALEIADRPPAAAWGHTYREEWSPADLAAVTIERVRRLGWDFVKFQPRATCFAEAFGSEYRAGGHSFKGPILVHTAVRGMDDWERLGAVDAEVRPLADQVESIRLVASGLGPRVPVMQTVFSPLTVAGYLVGKSKARVIRELRQEPKLVGAALEKIAAALVDFSLRSVEAGAAGIFYAVSGYASADVMTRPDYERQALPHDLQVLESLPKQAWFTVLHLCGSRVNFDLVADLPVRVISWSIHNRGNPSLAEVRDRYGKAVMGGLGQRTTLLRGPMESIGEEVRTAVQDTKGRGLLLAPGCSVPPWAPSRNLQAMMEAVA